MANEKTNVIIYWIATGLLIFGMALGGTAQITRMQFNADGMIHLGYPLYLMTIIGLWKLLGVIAILIPGYLLVKEWAYAGFFFVLTGGVFSHFASGDGIAGAAPAFVFACLTVVSWYFRPADRRLKLND